MKVSDIQNEQDKLFVLCRTLGVPPVEFQVAMDCMKIAKQMIELNDKANEDGLNAMDVFEQAVIIMEPYIK